MIRNKLLFVLKRYFNRISTEVMLICLINESLGIQLIDDPEKNWIHIFIYLLFLEVFRIRSLVTMIRVNRR